MCFFTTFNMMLGCGPIFLPGNFLADGWLLSTLFLFFVGVLSYFTTMFVVESMGLCNAILKKIKTCLVNNFWRKWCIQSKELPNKRWIIGSAYLRQLNWCRWLGQTIWISGTNWIWVYGWNSHWSKVCQQDNSLAIRNLLYWWFGI